MPEANNGAAMREAYESRGLTREQFARRVRLTPRSITNIANRGVCSRPAAVRIAKELGWPGPESLFGDATAGGETAEAEASAEASASEAETEADVRAAS
jgi:transcriptional regulator with XRE-family HTH domain